VKVLHAPKGQKALFDVTCTRRKRSEKDYPPRELWIRSNPDLARRVEKHEKQQAAAIAAWPPPSRPVGRPRKLPIVEAGTRENVSEPSSGDRGTGRERGRGREQREGERGWAYGGPRSQRRSTSEGDIGRHESRLLRCW